MNGRHGALPALLLSVAGLAAAAPVSVAGTDFTLVYDDTAASLLGTPTVVGNTIYFTPSAFLAESLNGAGLVEAMSSFSFELVANAGFSFRRFDLGAQGDYRVRGAGSWVDVTGGLSVTDGSATAARALNVAGLGQYDGALHDWTGDASLVASPTGWIANADSILFTIDNRLRAFTDSAAGSGAAFVQQKFEGLSLALEVGGQAVPLPGTLALASAGLLLLALGRRQKV